MKQCQFQPGTAEVSALLSAITRNGIKTTVSVNTTIAHNKWLNSQPNHNKSSANGMTTKTTNYQMTEKNFSHDIG